MVDSGQWTDRVLDHWLVIESVVVDGSWCVHSRVMVVTSTGTRVGLRDGDGSAGMVVRNDRGRHLQHVSCDRRAARCGPAPPGSSRYRAGSPCRIGITAGPTSARSRASTYRLDAARPSARRQCRTADVGPMVVAWWWLSSSSSS